MSAASQALGDAIKAVYEPDWPQSEEAYGSIEVGPLAVILLRNGLTYRVQAMEHLYSDHVDKLSECLINPLQGYVGQFPDIRVCSGHGCVRWINVDVDPESALGSSLQARPTQAGLRPPQAGCRDGQGEAVHQAGTGQQLWLSGGLNPASPWGSQVEEGYTEAQRAFELIDRECSDALPSLYDK